MNFPLVLMALARGECLQRSWRYPVLSSRYITLLAAAISIVSCLRASDLYAIGLAPNGKGTQDAYLYRVDRVGHKLDVVRDISSNPDFVFVDLERSIVVAAAPSGLPTQVSILDTRSPDETREVAFSYKEGGLSYAAVEVDVPAKCLYLAFATGRLVPPPPEKLDPDPTLTGVCLNAGSAGAESIPRSVLAYPRVMGLVGDRFPESAKLAPEVRGNPLRLAFSPDPPAPMAIPSPPREADYRLVVDNDELAVLLPLHESRTATFNIFDNHAAAWHEFSTPFPALFVRAFGYWLAFAGSEPAAGTRQPIPGAPLNHVTVVRGGAQAGSADNRQYVVAYRTTVEDEMQTSGHNHSGKLLLTNQKSGLEYEIDTGEADSEVVQVTDEFAIYRVNDRLLKSVMSGGRLLAPTEVAAGEEVVGVHWLFEGPVLPAAAGKSQ
jgi:hypothetical protein